MTLRSTLTALVLLCIVAGCRTPPPRNEPVQAVEPRSMAEQTRLASPERSGRILLALTFSGGGTRAAAFAYGTLLELADTTVVLEGRERRLLDEVDLISSVSGGSFTAAYFGLHGDGIFSDFEDVFLRKNVQRGLVLQLLSPRYWLGLAGGDRSQLAARYYDKHLFHEAIFGDMDRPGAPHVVINATDLSTAGRFPFMPYSFAVLCSDLNAYPVSHAVTASSAVPIVFPPVRLRSHAGTCDYELPSWLTAEDAREIGPLQKMLREELADKARSAEDREYIHLLDGGLSDNLGLLNGLGALVMIGDHQEAVRAFGHEDIELILIVTVNAESETERPWDRLDKPATSLHVVSGLTGAQITQVNKMTLKLARGAFGKLARDLSTPEKPVRFQIVELSFEKIPDEEERRFLRRIETSFGLSDKKVDRLIGAARQLLRDSKEFQEALAPMRKGSGSP